MFEKAKPLRENENLKERIKHLKYGENKYNEGVL